MLFLPAACVAGFVGMIAPYLFVFFLAPATIQMYGQELMPLFSLVGAIFFVVFGATMAPLRSKYVNLALLFVCLGISFPLFRGQSNYWFANFAVGLGGILGIRLNPFPAFYVRQCKNAMNLEKRRLVILKAKRADGARLWDLLCLYLKLCFRPALIGKYEHSD